MAYIDAGRFADAARSLQQALSAKADFPYAANAEMALHQIANRAR
jgi:hypothetical protein